MSAAGRIAWVLCALLCGGVAFASPTDRRTSAYYAHLDLTSTFDYYDNSWLKSEHHHQSPAAAPTWTPLEATIPGGNRSPETDEISAIPAAGTATLDLDVSYEYDLRGNRKVKNDASGTTNDATYDYDLDDRLTAETRGGPGGVGITYGYAKRGDLTTKTVGSATTTYLTDHMGRITALLGGGEHWHYTYAPTGDRFSKEDITVPGSGDMEVYLSSDGDTLIDYTKTGTGTLVFSGIYASPGVDGRVSRVNDLGETSYYFGDALQSVHQVTDATGTVTGTNFSDACGNKLAIGPTPPTGPGSRYSFQGREDDNESGLMHFRARSYDPMTGRFTSRDPVLQSNLYIFVENNAVNMTDPSGQLPDRKDLEGMSQPALVALATDYETARARAVSRGQDAATIQDLADSAAMARDVLISRKTIESPTVVGIATWAEFTFSTQELYAVGFHLQGKARGAEETFRGVVEGAPKIKESLSGLTSTTAAEAAEVFYTPLEQRAEALASYDPATVADATGRTDWDVTFAASMYYGPRAIGAKPTLVVELAERSPSAPVTGFTWNEVFSARYGAGNVEWVQPKLPLKPLTLGELKTPAGNFDLASGWRGYSPAMPKGSPGFDIVTRTHVEGQAAALMQKQLISRGVLYINNPEICPSCSSLLPKMLGLPGRRLVVVPKGNPPESFNGTSK